MQIVADRHVPNVHNFSFSRPENPHNPCSSDGEEPDEDQDDELRGDPAAKKMVNIDNNDTPPEKDQDDVAAAADDAEELFNDFGDGDNFSSDGEVYDDDGAHDSPDGTADEVSHAGVNEDAHAAADAFLSVGANSTGLPAPDSISGMDVLVVFDDERGFPFYLLSYQAGRHPPQRLYTELNFFTEHHEETKFELDYNVRIKLMDSLEEEHKVPGLQAFLLLKKSQGSLDQAQRAWGSSSSSSQVAATTNVVANLWTADGNLLNLLLQDPDRAREHGQGTCAFEILAQCATAGFTTSRDVSQSLISPQRGSDCVGVAFALALLAILPTTGPLDVDAINAGVVFGSQIASAVRGKLGTGGLLEIGYVHYYCKGVLAGQQGVSSRYIDGDLLSSEDRNFLLSELNPHACAGESLCVLPGERLLSPPSAQLSCISFPVITAEEHTFFLLVNKDYCKLIDPLQNERLNGRLGMGFCLTCSDAAALLKLVVANIAWRVCDKLYHAKDKNPPTRLSFQAFVFAYGGDDYEGTKGSECLTCVIPCFSTILYTQALSIQFNSARRTRGSICWDFGHYPFRRFRQKWCKFFASFCSCFPPWPLTPSYNLILLPHCHLQPPKGMFVEMARRVLDGHSFFRGGWLPAHCQCYTE